MGPAGPAWPGPAPERAPGDPAPHRLRASAASRDYPEQLAAFFEIPVDDLQGKAIADPYAAVRIDAAITRRTLAPGILVSGFVYDVDTGLVEITAPAEQE